MKMLYKKRNNNCNTNKLWRSNSKGFDVFNIVYLILMFVSTHTDLCLSSRIFAHRKIARCSGPFLFLLFLFFFINVSSFCFISTFIYFVHFIRLIIRKILRTFQIQKSIEHRHYLFQLIFKSNI